MATLLTPPNISTSHAFSHAAHTPSPALRLQLASNTSSTSRLSQSMGVHQQLQSGGAASTSSLLHPGHQSETTPSSMGANLKAGATRSSQGFLRSVTFQSPPLSPSTHGEAGRSRGRISLTSRTKATQVCAYNLTCGTSTRVPNKLVYWPADGS